MANSISTQNNLPEHLPNTPGSSSVLLQETPRRTPRNTTTNSSQSEITKKEERELRQIIEESELEDLPRIPTQSIPKKSIPLYVFFIFIIIDLVDIFAGMTFIISVIFNIIVGIFVARYVNKRMMHYKKELNRLTDLLLRIFRSPGGSKLKRKIAKIMARVLKKNFSGAISKKIRTKIVAFVIYGLVPFLQIIASWTFFLFVYNRLEEDLLKKINQDLENIVKALNA